MLSPLDMEKTVTSHRLIAVTGARPAAEPAPPRTPGRRIRANAVRAAASLALVISLNGCGEAEPAAPEPGAVTTESTSGALDSTAAQPAPPDACDLLTAEQITEATGLIVAVKVDVPDQCTWEVPDPKDSYYNALIVKVDTFVSVEEATRLFQPYVRERVTGIGDEASIDTQSGAELSARVGAVKISLAALNPAVTPEVIRSLGRTAAAKVTR